MQAARRGAAGLCGVKGGPANGVFRQAFVAIEHRAAHRLTAHLPAFPRGRRWIARRGHTVSRRLLKWFM